MFNSRFAHGEIIDCIKEEATKHSYGTFIDIGANDGTVTIAVAHLFQKCIAFEPVPSIFVHLQNRIALFPRCRAFQSALGENIGKGIIYYSNSDYGDNTVFPRGDLSRGIEVHVTTLDTICSEMDMPRPFLIKIDVQGYESFVFKGAETVLKETPFVVSEYWPWGILAAGATTSDYLTFMTKHGYFIYDLWKHGLAIGKLIQYPENQFHVSTDLVFEKQNH